MEHLATDIGIHLRDGLLISSEDQMFGDNTRLMPRAKVDHSSLRSALAPSLRRLTEPSVWQQAIILFTKNEDPEFSARQLLDGAIDSHPQWSDSFVCVGMSREVERKLIAISALCRIGLFHYRDSVWQPTWLWEWLCMRHLHRYDYNLLRNVFIQPFSDVLCTAYLKINEMHFSFLRNNENRNVALQLLSIVAGWKHVSSPIDVNRSQMLAVLSSLCAVGALECCGLTWVPTLYGLWLFENPGSPVNQSSMC